MMRGRETDWGVPLDPRNQFKTCFFYGSIPDKADIPTPDLFPVNLGI